MRFFVLKKPAFLTFNTAKYTENTSLMSKHQILSDGVASNAALVKHENGSWYIKYGNALLELRSIGTKDMFITSVDGNSGVFVEKTRKKWFLQNTANL